MPYLSGKQLADTVLTTANNKFNVPKIIILCEKEMNRSSDEPMIIGVNVVYIDNNVPNDIETIKSDIKDWYNSKNSTYNYFEDLLEGDYRNQLRILLPEYETTSNANTFAESLLNSEHVNIVNLSKEQVYGQGILDAGKAVQGIGAIDTYRLEDNDISDKYGNDKNYLYSVNTSNSSDNFKQRDYSIWSNDISEKKDGKYNYSAGLKKDGNVDLVLLGKNTYTGPTVVNSGRLQIVGGVKGDVYVGSSAGADAEINGYAKNLYALRSGNILVTDKVTEKIATGESQKANVDWYNKALPDKTTVNIDGGLFAIGNNAIAGTGSKIDVQLTNGDSYIKGPIYQDDNSKINMSLSNGANFNLLDRKGYYDGTTYEGNNKLNNLSLNDFGTFDISKDNTYNTFTINKLSGNNGLFIIKTDLKNSNGDFIKINNSEGSQEHNVQIIDDNSGIERSDGYSFKFADTPNNILFRPETTELSYRYKPLIDYIPNDNRYDWYLYGFESEVRNPINDIISTAGIYTTDDILKAGIKAPNRTIKINKGTSAAMLISKSGQKPQLIGIADSLNLIGNGDVRVEVKNDSINNTRSVQDVFTAGIAPTIEVKDYSHGFVEPVEYKFTANQNISLDVTGDNNTYGIYAPSGYVGLDRTESEYFDINFANKLNFARDLSINVKSNNMRYGAGIAAYGDVRVGGNTNISVDTEGYAMGIGAGDKGGNVENPACNMSFDGDVNISIHNADYPIGVDNVDNMVFRKDLTITSLNGHEYGYGVTCADDSQLTIDGNLDINYDNGIAMRIGKNANINIAGNAILKANDGIRNSGKLNIGGLLDITAAENDIFDSYNVAIDNEWNSTINVDAIKTNGRIDNTGMLTVQSSVNAGSIVNNRRVSGSREPDSYVIDIAGDVIATNTVSNGEGATFKARDIKTDNLFTGENGLFTARNVEVNSEAVLKGKNILNSLNLKGSLLLDGENDINELAVKNNTIDDNFYVQSGKATFKNVYLDSAGNGINSSYSDGLFHVTNNFTIRNKSAGDTAIEADWYDNTPNKAIDINSSGKGTVQIIGKITGDSIGINMSNQDSYIITEKISTSKMTGNDSTGINMSNGSVLQFADHSTYHYVDDESYITKLSLNSNSQISLYSPSCKADIVWKTIDRSPKYHKNISIGTLSGTGGIFNLGITQDTTNRGKIYSDTILIWNNLTPNAVHTIKLEPTQADFILTNDISVEPFKVAEDHSVSSSSNVVTFNVVPFDAGLYNYTPTIKSTDYTSPVDSTWKYNEWQITDIKRTGESGGDNGNSGTPGTGGDNGNSGTPGTSGDNGNSGTPGTGGDNGNTGNNGNNNNGNSGNNGSGNGNGNGTGTGSQPVISNLAHNIQGAAVNNFFRFHNEYNNINRRLGNLRMAAEDEGAWVRYMAGKDDSDAYGFSERYSGTQVGYDKSVTMDDGGKWFFGGAVSYYKGSTSYAHQGSSEDRSRGLALYASYLGDKGHYLDIIARHSKLTSEMDSYAAGTGAMVHGEMDTWGTSLGVEYGRKISMGDGFYWQPEAELIYGSIAGTEYTMSDGTHVNQGGINSLTMRTGVTLGRQIKDVSYFVSASYNHDFSTTSSVSMRDKYGATYSTDRNLANSWWTVALGAAANVSKNTYCYIDLEKSFGGDITKKWQVNAGVRFSF